MPAIQWLLRRAGWAPDAVEGEPTMTVGVASDPQQWIVQFEHHWQTARSIMDSNRAATTQEHIDKVFKHLEQMAFLLLTEVNSSPIPLIGPILDVYFTEEIMSIVLQWCLATAIRHTKQTQVRLLKLYETMVVSTHTAQHSMLVHKPILVPLLHLLDWVNPNATDSTIVRHARGAKVNDVEKHFVLLLNQICTKMAENSTLLEFFFDTKDGDRPTKATSTQLSARRHSMAASISTRTETPRFLVFTLMIPYLYEEGDVGQLARDALLLILTVSRRNEKVAMFIAQSDFAAVLAAGLGACYSELPRRLAVADEWCSVSVADMEACRPLHDFHSALSFCNAVVQVCHKQVAARLVAFIYDAFLVPVVKPALLETQLDEMISSTAYLELCARSIVEPSLVRCIVRFLVSETDGDDEHLLDILVRRIASNNRMCQVSLALFGTLLDMNCEDLMVELVLKHLLPCTHVMSSQVAHIGQVDVWGECANQLLALSPPCASLDKPPPCASDDEQPESVSAHFAAYLSDAQRRVKSCHDATRRWRFRWDGSDPDASEFRGDLSSEASPRGTFQRETLARGSTRKYNVYFTRRHSSTQSVKSGGNDGNSNGVDLSVLGTDFLTLADDDLDYVDRLLMEEGDGNESEASTPRYRKAQLSGFFTLAFDADVTDTDAEPTTKQRRTTVESGGESDTSGFVLQGWSKIDNEHAFTQLLSTVRPTHTAQTRSLAESKTIIDRRYSELIAERHAYGEDDDLLKLRRDDDGVTTEGSTGEKGMDEDMGMTSVSSPRRPNADGIPIECGEAMFGAQLGPLLDALLARLDVFTDNPLVVNLQLTGVLSRLACYPQPLLRSLFFHPSLVFEQNVRSLMHILAHVNAQVSLAADEYATEGGMQLEVMLQRGWRYLESRQRRQHGRRSTRDPLESMGFTAKTGRRESDAQSSNEGGSARGGSKLYQHQSMHTQAATDHHIKARNLVFCAIVLREFVQEMAALSLQHSALAFV